MTKAHRDAFNSAYIKILKSDKRTVVPSRNGKGGTVVVPMSVITKEMSKFIKKVTKDLKLNKTKGRKK